MKSTLISLTSVLLSSYIWRFMLADRILKWFENLQNFWVFGRLKTGIIWTQIVNRNVELLYTKKSSGRQETI